MAGPLTRRSLREPARSTRDLVQRLQNEMDDMITRFFGDDMTNEAGMLPSLDMSETENSIEVRMDIPGIKPEDIDIQLHGNQLTVHGRRSEEREEQGRTYHRIERSMGTFTRSVTLPINVSEEQVDARYRDGVLTISMPKPAEAKRQRIEVKSEGAAGESGQTIEAGQQSPSSPMAQAPAEQQGEPAGHAG